MNNNSLITIFIEEESIVDWNCLMKAVDKIRKIKHIEFNYYSNTNRVCIVDMASHIYDEMFFDDTTMFDVYKKAIVAFIKWYNKKQS